MFSYHVQIRDVLTLSSFNIYYLQYFSGDCFRFIPYDNSSVEQFLYIVKFIYLHLSTTQP